MQARADNDHVKFRAAGCVKHLRWARGRRLNFWGASLMDTWVEVLITGATGFLGGCTAADLVDSDFAGLLLFLVRAPTRADGLQRLRDSLRRFHVSEDKLAALREDQVVCGDLTDVASFASDPRLDRVTHVLHCAAIASFANHPGIHAVNVEGTFAFAQRMSRAPKLRRFVHVGTAMACGPNRTPPIVESNELNNTSAKVNTSVGGTPPAPLLDIKKTDGNPVPTSGAGEIGDGEVGAARIFARFPRDHRFDRELGERLQPSEQGQRHALRDQELRRFRAPGHEERREQNARERPQGGRRGASRRRQGGDYL